MKPTIDFDEYIRQGEPDKREKASIWQTAIGLQAVDGLQTSDYLKETARKHIEGEINIDEARNLIRTYYQSKTVREPDDDEKQEADKVSANITKILIFSPAIRGTSAMRWYVPTTKMLKQALTILQSIWSVFSVICCLANNGIYATDTCIFTQQQNGAYSLI